MSTAGAAVRIRKALEADFAAIVALNADEVRHTSAMDLARLRQLDALACHHKVAEVDGEVAAFVLAMRAGCGYQNSNFSWFATHYDDYLYVDRIVVGARWRGLKLGSPLYRDLFAQAHAARIAVVACEYNVVPPNEASRVFHDRFGFIEVGRQWLDGDAKQVSLQVAPVDG